MSTNSYANLKLQETSAIMSLTSAILSETNKRDSLVAAVSHDTNTATTTTTKITYKTQQQQASPSPMTNTTTVLSNNVQALTGDRDRVRRASSIKRSANDFRFLKAIGEGSFSTVYLAQDIHTKTKYASEYIQKKSLSFFRHEKANRGSLARSFYSRFSLCMLN
jgi:hypothetical protein